MGETSMQTIEVVRRMRVRVDGRVTEARFDGDRIVFDGPTGRHSISADSSAERVVAHWEGYLEYNGIDPTTTPGSVFHRRSDGGCNDRLVAVKRRGPNGGLYERCIYRGGRVGRERCRPNVERSRELARAKYARARAWRP